MIFTVMPTFIYLMSMFGSSLALPTSTANFRNLNFGFDFEQTTRRSGPTTTIDYDLADFDEFGTDPGIYDVAGSPDAIHFADDNDQGFPNQQDFDTGQSLFGSGYTVTPGISKSPAGSGGISGEIQEHVGTQQEGGPSDEGVNPYSHQEQLEMNKRHESNIRQKTYRAQNNMNNNNQPTHGEGAFTGNENQNKSSPNKAHMTGNDNSALPPDSNENDKSDNINYVKQSNQEYGAREEGDRVTDTSTMTRTNSNHKEDTIKEQSTDNSSVNLSSNTKDADTRKENAVTKFVETASSSRDISVGSPESEFTSMSGEKFDSFSVYDSNSGEVSENSKSNEGNKLGGISSIEIVSGEDVNDKASDWKSASLQEGHDVNTGATDSFGSSERTDSRLSSNEEYFMSSEKTVSKNYAESTGSQSSKDDGSVSSSDENGSSSSDENSSQSTSDENKSSSDENWLQFTSDENRDSSSLMSPGKKKFEPQSDETTEKSSTDPDNDFDNDYDYVINDSEQTSSDMENPAKYGTNGNDGSDASSSVQNHDLAGCFSSTEDDGKFCPLLRSLYSICSVQFKQECVSDMRKSRQSNRKVHSNSNANSASFADTSASSESMEDLYPNSLDSIASGESSPSSSKSSSMSIETVENLSASFERSSGILDVISIIREACSGVCALADSHARSQSDNARTGSVRDEDSSESSDEDDFRELPTNAFTDSDEDPNEKKFDFSHVTSVEIPASEPADSTDDKSISSMGSGEYSMEKNTNERSAEDSFTSSGGTDSINSADSSGEHSFEYAGYVSENMSE